VDKSELVDGGVVDDLPGDFFWIGVNQPDNPRRVQRSVVKVFSAETRPSARPSLQCNFSKPPDYSCRRSRLKIPKALALMFSAPCSKS
jgi:hypothetical protein